MDAKYWIGPYGVRIPNNIYFVVAKDGENTVDKWGGSTSTYCTSILTKNQYINKYCYYGNDGYYYYDKNRKYYCEHTYYKGDECCCCPLF